VIGRIVLDASAALHIVLRTENAVRLAEVVANAALVLAPTLFAAESANGLWKYVLAGELEAAAALEHRQEAVGLIDSFVPDSELCAESLSESIRVGHPVYDLLYAVLARRNGCAVLTMDGRLRELLDRLEIPAAGKPA
jgi:predicted nucleic acid-binding protein